MNKNNLPEQEERNNLKHSVLLSFGSNLGDKVQNIENALALLAEQNSVQIITRSSFYETEPWGKSEQPKFINSVALFKTSLSPNALLKLLKHIELMNGRQIRERWGEREIDIDILLYDALIYNDTDLTIPHPEMHRRNFVLIPACEIAPNLHHPILNKSIKSLSENSDDKLKVNKISI